MYKEFRDEIEFIGISADTKKDIDKFMKENSFTFPVVHDETNIVSRIFHERVPAHILISKEGSVKYSEPEPPDDVKKYLKDSLR